MVRYHSVTPDLRLPSQPRSNRRPLAATKLYCLVAEAHVLQVRTAAILAASSTTEPLTSGRSSLKLCTRSTDICQSTYLSHVIKILPPSPNRAISWQTVTELPRYSRNLHKRSFIIICLNLLIRELAFIDPIASFSLSAYTFVMRKMKAT